MAKELDAIPAASCTIENDSVSFLKQIVYPIYETLAVEAARNNNGKAAHSAWSPACLVELTYEEGFSIFAEALKEEKGSLDVLVMFGAYTTARGMAISRLVIRIFWFGFSSVAVTYIYLSARKK
ncbi:hypothetical protein ABKV19_012079 [Rosa sericea]